jgi:hypothetical protein
MEYSLNIPQKIPWFSFTIFEIISFEIFNILQIIYKN